MAAGLGDGEDTIPDVLHFPNSLASTTFFNEIHNFSEYVADGDCCQGQGVVARLGDSEDTVLTANIPILAAEVLDELPDLSKYVAEGGCPKDRTMAVGLGHGKDGVPHGPDVSSLTTSLNKLPHLLDTGQRAAATRSKWQR